MVHLQHWIMGPGPEREFIVVADREPTPQLHDASVIHDIWKNYLLQDKWKQIVVDTIHLAEPALMTVTMQSGVATMARGITLFRIASPTPNRPEP